MILRTIWQTISPAGVLLYFGENSTRAHELALRTGGRAYSCIEPTPQAPKTSASTPYPWCRDPDLCHAKGYCPRDPSCGD